MIQQIWINLMDNAIKFSKPGGTIKIRLVPLGDGIEFSIEDDGVGFDQSISDKIFDSFYQGDPSRNLVGNGLGLAIVKRICELNQGRITAQSEVGKGSVFTVYLPNLLNG
jgi:signal transduction histidine kinase